MSDQEKSTYLKDLFINEAKPALKRHSGGGGGSGSSDLIDCETFPTENVEEGKIYRRQYTEVLIGEYEIWFTNGDGSEPEKMALSVLPAMVTDKLEDVADGTYLYTVDGKMYMVESGTVIDFAEANGGSQRGFIASPAELDLYALEFGVIKNETVHDCMNIGSHTDKDLVIHQYANGSWNEVGLVRNLIRFNPLCFKGATMTSLNGILGFRDTSNVTDMRDMFNNCSALTEVPLFDTSKVTDMGDMFYKCSALTKVPLFDTREVTSMSFMFNRCTKLTECYLKNIRTSLQVGSGTQYGHLLTMESLIHLIKELRDVGSSQTLTIGSANLAKLANVYVRTIDITDEMRAEDDLIDEKLPFEVCESTDEGATLITDYVGFKRWSLA